MGHLRWLDLSFKETIFISFRYFIYAYDVYVSFGHDKMTHYVKYAVAIQQLIYVLPFKTQQQGHTHVFYH